MPHFECGAFNHSATSPRAEVSERAGPAAAGPEPRWSAGQIAWAFVFHKRQKRPSSRRGPIARTEPDGPRGAGSG